MKFLGFKGSKSKEELEQKVMNKVKEMKERVKEKEKEKQLKTGGAEPTGVQRSVADRKWTPADREAAMTAIREVRRAISAMYLAGYSKKKARIYVTNMPEFFKAMRLDEKLIHTEKVYMDLQKNRHQDYIFVARKGPRAVRALAEESYEAFLPNREDPEHEMLEELDNWCCNWKDEIQLLRNSGTEARADEFETEITETLADLQRRKKRRDNLRTFEADEEKRKAVLASGKIQKSSIPGCEKSQPKDTLFDAGLPPSNTQGEAATTAKE